MSLDWLIGGSSRLPFAILLSLRSQLSDRLVVSGLTVFAVASSVALAMSVEVASRGLQDQLRTTTEALIGSAALSITAGDVGVPEGVLEQVDAVPGVVSASPLIRRTFRVGSGVGRGRAIHVVGVDLLSENDVRRFEMSRAGVVVRDAVRLLALPDSIVVSARLAADLGISDGDRLELALDGRRVDLVVRGILRGELAEAFGGQIAAMDIFALQQVVGMAGRFDRVDIAVELHEDLEEVTARIAAAIDPALSIGRDEERESFGLALLRTYQRALWAMVLVALATAALLTYAVSSMSIDRRLEELSLLRAAGMEGTRVGRAILADALVIAGAGTALGAAAAPFVARAVSEVLSVASAVLNEVELEAAPLAASTVALGLAVGISGVVAAAVPAARRAARIGPFELLDLGRGVVRLSHTRQRALGFAVIGAAVLAAATIESPATTAIRVVAALIGGIALSGGLGHILIDRGAHPDGWLSRLVPRVGFLIGPSLRDRPVEAALTMAAWTTIAAGLVTGVTTIRSYTGSIDDYYYGLYGESAVLLLVGDPFGSKDLKPIPAATLEALRATGKVEEIAPVRGIRIPFRGTEIVVGSFATDAMARRGKVSFVTRDPEAMNAALKRGELVMNESLGERFGTHVGDRIELATQQGPRSFRIGASVRGLAGPNGSLYLDESVFAKTFSESAVTTWMAALWLTLPDEESLDALLKVESVEPLFFLRGREARRWVARSAEKYRTLLSVPVALVCGLGLISLLSLLFGATRSRGREFALLRAAGATRANVVAIVTLGGAAVGILGALLGIAVGAVWSTVTCNYLSESIGWRIDPTLSADLALAVFGCASGIALLGSLVPALFSTQTRELAVGPTP